MLEPIGRTCAFSGLGAQHDFGGDGRVEAPLRLFAPRLGDQGKRVQIEDRADAGGSADHLLRRLRQLADAVDDQIGDVVGDLLGPDPVQVPGPSIGARVDQAFAMQRHQELSDKERVAAGLGPDQARQVVQCVGGASQRRAGHRRDVVLLQRTDGNHLAAKALTFQVIEEIDRGMGGANLVVAIGGDKREVSDIAVAHDQPDQVARCRIGPLQIIQENDQRRVFLCQTLEKAPEYQRDANACLVQSQPCNRWLGADQRLEFRQQIQQNLTVRADGIQNAGAPIIDDIVGRRQNPAQQKVAGLDHRAIGARAIQLVEFAVDEMCTCRHGIGYNGVHQRGLADTRGTGDAIDPIGAAGAVRDVAAQAFQILVPTEQSVGQGKPHGHDTAVQCVQQVGRRLKSVLGRLGQQGHDRLGQIFRHIRIDQMWRCGMFGHVGVQDLRRILACERPPTGQKLIEHHAKRIEIGAMIDAQVCPAALFRRHIGSRPLGQKIAGLLQRQILDTDGQAIVDQFRRFQIGRDDDVRRLDIAVDDTGAMQIVKNLGDRDCQGANLVRRQDPRGMTVQRDQAFIVENQPRGVRTINAMARCHMAGMGQSPGNLELVVQALDRAGIGQGGQLQDHRSVVGGQPGTAHRKGPTFTDHVAQRQIAVLNHPIPTLRISRCVDTPICV